MINKIIWKVILMFGGIAGAIFSIPKMYEPYTNLENAKLNLSSAEARNLSQHIIRKYERDITNYGEELFAWGLLLVASIIAFIIGCRISVKLKQEENNQLPPLF